MPELADKKFERFMEQYDLSEYDSLLLVKEKTIADYFEKAMLGGNKYKITAKEVANFIINQKISPDDVLPSELIKRIILAKQTVSISDDDLEKIFNKVLNENTKAVEDFKSGKTNAIMFLIGQIMKEAKQKLDTKLVREKLEKNLKK